MRGRSTNQGLLIALVVALVSGPAMYAVGSGWNRWPTVLHGASGAAVVLLAPWKSLVVRRGVRRRGAWRALPSFVLLVAVLITLGTGILHRLDQRDLGPVLVVQVHVGAAVVALVTLLRHVRTRPSQLRVADLDRRALLIRGGAVAAGATAATLSLPHAGDRATRSLERGSFAPAAMPVVQWLDDDVPAVDPDGWRLAVGGRRWRLDELEAIAQAGRAERIAALDCTGGWYARQRWAGTDLRRLLDLSDLSPGRSVRVESETGYWRRFPYPQEGDLLLALRVGGAPLSPGHGFPARIVAPGRRGFWWVKWVSTIDVDDTPWWWQPPFPVS